MIPSTVSGFRRLSGVVLAVTALAALSPTAASASVARGTYGDTTSGVKVMTRNLYLGADLTPALTATDPTSFIGAVAQIYGTAQYTNFPARAQALANEINTTRPDLIGLQEVSIWETSGPGAPATLDFLTTLQAALAQRGLNYKVAAVSNNANIGPIPLVQPCASDILGACLVTLKDRDVILVNANNTALTYTNPASGNYTAQQYFQPPVPGAAPISFNRGWASIDAKLGRTSFKFVNTHLETETFPAVQEAETAEFLTGPASSTGRVVITGDFNSAADGSTTKSYANLRAAGLRDAWSSTNYTAGLSCCQSETLTNATSQATSRIDFVFTRNLSAQSARLVGNTPFSTTAPLWASDHAGVVASVKLCS